MPRCPVCHRGGGAGGIRVAIVVLLVLAAAYFLVFRCMGGKEGFVSGKAKQVFDSAKPLFEKTGGRPSYSEYKMRVPGADPVQYTDLKALWGKGTFTPENVQTSL